jgi:PAS domain-containing protein
MIKIADPVRRWTRQLGELRVQAVKSGRAAGAELVENALTLCDSLLRDLAGLHLECDNLRAEVRTRAAAWDHLFEVMPAACVLTDSAGEILNANRPAGTLLNLSAKALKGRQLGVFSEDRQAFETLLLALAASDDQRQATLVLRPRDRKPADIDVVIVPATEARPARWLWFLGPAMRPQKVADAQLHPVVGSLSSTMGSPEPM